MVWKEAKKKHRVMITKNRLLRKEKAMNAAVTISIYGSCPGWELSAGGVTEVKTMRKYIFNHDQLSEMNELAEKERARTK